MIEKYSKIIVDTILKKEPPFVGWDKIDFTKLLIQASQNRVLYLLAKNLLSSKINLGSQQNKDLLRNVLKEGEERLERLKKTLLLLEDVLKKNDIDYLIVKTFKYLDYVTFDVDVLVKYQDFERVIRVLKNNNFQVLSHPNPCSQGLHQRNCLKQGFLKIDLHRKFFWLGIDHIDLDFVWQNTTEREIAGVKCPTPSLEADFLLHNKQLVCERGYITLLDFLALKYANDTALNWDKIMGQVIKHKWENAFFVLMHKLNQIDQEIFGQYMIDINKYFPKKEYKISEKELKLPLIFSLKEIVGSFSEIALKHKHLPILELFYYFFVRTRYLINHRLPFYDHWYDFDFHKSENLP